MLTRLTLRLQLRLISRFTLRLTSLLTFLFTSRLRLRLPSRFRSRVAGLSRVAMRSPLPIEPPGRDPAAGRAAAAVRLRDGPPPPARPPPIWALLLQPPAGLVEPRVSPGPPVLKPLWPLAFRPPPPPPPPRPPPPPPRATCWSNSAAVLLSGKGRPKARAAPMGRAITPVIAPANTRPNPARGPFREFLIGRPPCSRRRSR